MQIRKGVIPPDAIYVGRDLSLGGGLITDGIHFGNPFKVKLDFPASRRAYQGNLEEFWDYQPAYRAAASKFCNLLKEDLEMQARARNELRGKTLVCHCHPHLCCHADVLLKLANGERHVYCVEFCDFIGG